ncbi:hypothetical protein DSM03_101386 [Leeuwenhoekiella aestuarii]|uniref:Uncharacterized protein n=1 Tax=Leeuwenhoekiella aestuarii TaxID=2249426 RepID=A0A4Q0NT59_9FLAO|nr:hypothetical protein [Leeuwenhoekiella aestuarii]RXG14269.1 hypothetical protein DSM04_104377 [Leeuwenhoekiella aestuarii]RXG19018.1 hypothetical protein DSM03_101386 [Leeuwenhoekiella aestuarii]
MKTILFVAAMALGTLSIHAQDTCTTPKLKAGDVLKIASPSTSSFEHINFPKSNFIIKRGGIANYRSLINKEIEVTEVTEENGCVAQVDVKLKDGKKFFNTVETVRVDLKKALDAGEIVLE